MARPGQLAIAIADVFDEDLPTVRHKARMLRDAGYMSMEKAGRGTGSMTPRDATNLLISAAGSSRVKHATRPVDQHGACKSAEGSWNLPFEGLPELLALGPDHTFADTIEALIRAAISGSVNLATGILREAHQGALSIAVDIREPYAMSTVQVGLHGRDGDGAPTVVNSLSRRYDVGYVDGHFLPQFAAFPISDLTHTHSFTEKAIYRIAEEFL